MTLGYCRCILGCMCIYTVYYLLIKTEHPVIFKLLSSIQQLQLQIFTSEYAVKTSWQVHLLIHVITQHYTDCHGLCHRPVRWFQI